MAESLATAEGEQIPTDTTDMEFAAAMAAAAGDSDVPAPPKLPAPDADAPYGRTAEGKPKRGPGGRPPKTDRARVADKAPKASASSAPADYSAGLADTLDGAAIALGMAPAPILKAQAAIIRRNKDNTITGLNLAAQNNAWARRVIAPLASGQVSWYILAAMALAPAVAQSVAIWKAGPDSPLVAGLAAESDQAMAADLAKLGVIPEPEPAEAEQEQPAA